MKYEFSSVQIMLPDGLAKRIINWGEQNIPDEDIFRDPNNASFGREDEIHITVLYGLHSRSAAETREIISKVKPFTIELGKISLFSDGDKFDVVKIGVKSPELHDLNAQFRSKVDFTNKYDRYMPHVTIAYVKKGRGWKHSGNPTFDGELFEADHVVFSPKNGTKTRILLR